MPNCYRCRYASTPSAPNTGALHSQYFRGHSLASETYLNVLQCSFVELVISQRFLCIKGGQRICMHGAPMFDLAVCLQMYCTTEYIAVGFDALRSTI